MAAVSRNNLFLQFNNNNLNVLLVSRNVKGKLKNLKYVLIVKWKKRCKVSNDN